MAKYTSKNLRKEQGMSTRFKWGISLFVVSLVLFLIVVTNFIVPIHNFILGVFGLCIYPVLLVLMGAGILLMKKKQYAIAKIYFITIISLFVILICFFQLVLNNYNVTFSEYISNCYINRNTAGGVLFGSITYLLYLGLGLWGSILLEVIGIVICVALIVDHFLKMKEGDGLASRVISFPSEKVKEKAKNVFIKKQKQKEVLNTTKPKENKLVIDNYIDKREKAKESLLNRTSYKNEEDIAVHIFGEDFINNHSSKEPEKECTLQALCTEINNKKAENVLLSREDILKPNKIIHNEEQPRFQSKFDVDTNSYKTIQRKEDSNRNNEIISTANGNSINLDTSIQNNVTKTEKEEIKPITPLNLDNEIDLGNEDISNIIAPKPIQKTEQVAPKFEIKNESVTPKFEVKNDFKMNNSEKPIEKPRKKQMHIPYIKPPMDLLVTKTAQFEENKEIYQQKASVLESTLDSFKIPAKVVGITRGPAVTRYELQMPFGIPVKRITQHSDDITMMLKSRNDVRIETPIPGRDLVGVEVPNDKIATIGLRDVLDSSEFKDSQGALTFALGKDIAGECKVCNLESMPHLLVAGTTGSGKSVCLNVILISLLYKLGPEDLKILLIDPKRVEFVTYNNLPHMLVPKAISDPKQALNALDWTINEMTRRFDLFSSKQVRNFKEYNKLPEVISGEEEKLPYIVIIIDEFGDLMISAGRELEDRIQRLTQLARAAGIHLIVATQRPSVNVITGVIKANLPSRIAFAVTDFASSKTILDQGGADKLLGRGDMLYSPNDSPEPIRIQCPYVDGSEVREIVDFIKEYNTSEFDDSIGDFIAKGDKNSSTSAPDNSSSDSSWDPLLPIALRDFMECNNEGSASMIQRRHSVGFVRAGRIIDQMEQAGFISKKDPAKQMRTVLITEEQYREIFGEEY